MKKFIPTALLGVAGAVVIGLIGMQAPSVNADEALKRDDDAVELVLVADDDDDDTNDDTDGATNGDDDTRSRSRATNDNTNSRSSKVSRDRDASRGDMTRDFTRDGGGEKKRDWSAGSTNDRSRNDTRR